MPVKIVESVHAPCFKNISVLNYRSVLHLGQLDVVTHSATHKQGSMLSIFAFLPVLY